MPRHSFNMDDSIGVVSRREYETEREARLRGEELAETSKYKVRLTPTPQTVAKYAIDFLCQIHEVAGPVEDTYAVAMNVVDKDGRVEESNEVVLLYLNTNAVLLDLDNNGIVIHNSEKGYFLTALDEWDLAWAGLGEAVNIKREESARETTPTLA